MTEVKKQETKPEVKEQKVKFKEGQTDFEDYQKFAELKFVQWGDDGYQKKRLKPEAVKVFEKLEAKFKDYPGKKPTVDKTVFLGIGIPYARIVKGFGVPPSLYELFVEEGKAEGFFE